MKGEIEATPELAKKVIQKVFGLQGPRQLYLKDVRLTPKSYGMLKQNISPSSGGDVRVGPFDMNSIFVSSIIFKKLNHRDSYLKNEDKYLRTLAGGKFGSGKPTDDKCQLAGSCPDYSNPDEITLWMEHVIMLFGEPGMLTSTLFGLLRPRDKLYICLGLAALRKGWAFVVKTGSNETDLLDEFTVLLRGLRPNDLLHLLENREIRNLIPKIYEGAPESEMHGYVRLLLLHRIIDCGFYQQYPQDFPPLRTATKGYRDPQTA
jgi:hypothetical protein